MISATTDDIHEFGSGDGHAGVVSRLAAGNKLPGYFFLPDGPRRVPG